MAWGIGNIFKAMKEGMTDDEGGFQGGTQDRLFGRGRDALANLFGGGERKRSRKFAEDFDPESGKDVLKMQQMLNSLGYKDYEGNELSEDAMIGDKTLSALRKFQSGAGNQDIPFAPGAYGPDSEERMAPPSGGAGSSWTDWLFGDSAADKTESARDAMFDQTESGEWQRKVGPRN